jgi:hypothetical protein
VFVCVYVSVDLYMPVANVVEEAALALLFE